MTLDPTVDPRHTPTDATLAVAEPRVGIKRGELLELVDRQEENSLSFYFDCDPTDVRQGSGALRALVGEVGERLAAHTGGEIAAKMLQRVRAMVDGEILHAKGAAVFQSPAYSRVVPLPFGPGNGVTLSRRFLITPLLPLLDFEGAYYVLALSQNRVRLMEATRTAFQPITSPALPTKLTDVVGEDWEQRHLQMRTGTGRAQFHGHGEQKDSLKDEVERLLREVDRGLDEALSDPDAAIVLAGVKELTAAFRRVSRVRTLASQEVAGNCDRLDDHELHAKSWPAAEEFFLERAHALQQKVLAAVGTARGTDVLSDVLEGAHSGRVEAVLINNEHRLWGTFDPLRPQLEVTDPAVEGAEDLLNLAAAWTLQHGGKADLLHGKAAPEAGAVALYRY